MHAHPLSLGLGRLDDLRHQLLLAELGLTPAASLGLRRDHLPLRADACANGPACAASAWALSTASGLVLEACTIDV